MKKNAFFFLAVGVVSLFAAVAQTVLTSPESPVTFNDGTNGASAGLAEQEFRRGVQAYHRGTFNEAILLFERALSALPDEPLILEWLGNAYYRSGIEGAALDQWEYAARSGYGGQALRHKIDFLQTRRINANLSTTYTEAGLYRGSIGDSLLFSQPTSLLPNIDGSFWAAAYSSNEVIKLDANGQIINRVRGPLGNGFSKPMDILRLGNGTLAVSEFFADRISVLDERGIYLRSFGSKGTGPGQVIGPQYMVQDGAENLYVTDFGNARVVVFDKDGRGILSFGGKTSNGFPGFQAPTGIAIMEDLVFVADAVTGAVYAFDRFGNYGGEAAPEKTFVRPEAMKVYQDSLLVADGNRVLLLDPENGTVTAAAKTGNAPSRLTSAVPDQNGNLLASDFLSNEIYVLSRLEDLVAGLSVRVLRVTAENFPEVTLEVSVENLHRDPVVGLTAANFLVTEGKRIAANQQLLGVASYNTDADITIMVDRTPAAAAKRQDMEWAVKELAASFAEGEGGTLRIVAAGDVPATEFTGSAAEAAKFSADRLQTPVSRSVKTDLAVRLAGNDLVNGRKKRAIIYITAGALSAGAFDRYGLTDLCTFLNNNQISFYTVNLDNEPLAEEIRYLTANTRGSGYYVYRSEGLSSIVKEIAAQPSGLYLFSYTSSLPTDFGRAYLPVEVECYHLNQSGRGESAYFAPLQ